MGQECPTRVSQKSFLQECLTRVSHKSDPQECPIRVAPLRPKRSPLLQGNTVYLPPARPSIHECGLARTTGAHQGCQVAGVEHSREVLENLQLLLVREWFGGEDGVQMQETTRRVAWHDSGHLFNLKRRRPLCRKRQVQTDRQATLKLAPLNYDLIYIYIFIYARCLSTFCISASMLGRCKANTSPPKKGMID